MTTIGYATLQIIPSLKGVSESVNKQLSSMPDLGGDAGKLLGKNLGKNLGDGVGDGAKRGANEIKGRLSERLGADVGQALGRGIGGALHGSITVAAKAGELALKGAMVGAAGVAAAAVGGIGLALTKGFDRLKSIDQAKFKLQALGNDAASISKIMDSALASVKGTAFGMDDAVTAAASAVAAGIKPGQDLTKYLKDVGDAASIAGTSFEDMGSIFNKIQTSNKAYTDDLQQLSDRGIPIFAWLQKEYGVTGDKLSEMVQKGEVDAAHFQHAIETNIGGAALKMGQSFEGSVQNAEAALGRLGAAFLAPIFGNAAGGIGSITDGLDKMTAWVGAHQPEIINFFTDMGVAAVSVAQDIVKSFGNILQGVGDFTHALGTVVSLFDADKGAALQATGDKLNDIGVTLINTANGFDAAKEKIRNWGAAAAEAASNAQNAVGGAVTGIATQVGALPFKKVIEISAATDDAEGKLRTVGNSIRDLPFKKTVEVEIHGTATGTALPTFLGAPVLKGGLLDSSDQRLPGGGASGPGKATGGAIAGPGGRTSDIIPIWASNGEHMWTADEVDAVGGQSGMYRMRRLALAGAFGKFATGGAVGPDVQAATDLAGITHSQSKRTDCSGMVARVIDRTLGMPESGLMSTKNAAEWLAARGFKPGIGGPGQISVGWYDHGPNPNDGHMAMTLSNGINAESGGKNGVFTIGPGASGATSPQFDQHMFLPTLYGEGPAGSAAASPFAGGSAVAAAIGGGTPAVSGGGGGSSSSGGGSSSFSLPSSFGDLAAFGLNDLGKGVGATKSGSDLSVFGKAAGSAVSGQIDSALGVLGVNGSPGWLKAVSTLVGGISIGGDSAAPLSASPSGMGTPPPDDPGNMHGTRAGQQPGPTYNVYAKDAEDALDRLQRLQDRQTAAKLGRF